MSISASLPPFALPSSMAAPSARLPYSRSPSRNDGFPPVSTSSALPPLSPPSSPAASTKSSGDDSTSSLKSRPVSLYTLSRPSLAEKVAELAAIPQPDRPCLSDTLSAFNSAAEAADALFQSGQEIHKWVDRAAAVLRSLDAEGDVSWATASGRDGLEEVDSAISRFGGMVSLYVSAVEELQSRRDVSLVDPKYLTRLVEQVEVVASKWQDVKVTLVHVKAQVEIALEWEELWDSVIGEIALEITALRRLIFQMEERRHRSTLTALTDTGNAIDLCELETIVEEAPTRRNAQHPIHVAHMAADSGKDSQGYAPGNVAANSEDSNLLALFARMQPLRASLDFLPMRLANFLSRGRDFFPHDCDDLEDRRIQLEKDWRALEANAEALRRELGEDQWVLVFRNAGRQAMKMCESVARAVVRLRDGLDEEVGRNTLSPTTLQNMESYEAKKVHYGSAIERVLTIIDRGVKDRLTVNGEILRLQSEMRRRWSDLQDEIKAVDFVLEKLDLTDARIQAAAMAVTPISRLPIEDTFNFNTPALPRAQFGSSPRNLLCTPGSSPASSAVLPRPATSVTTKSRQSSFNSTVTGVSTSAATTASSHSIHRRSSGAKLSGTTNRLHSSLGAHSLNRKPSMLTATSQTASTHSSSSKANAPMTPKSLPRPPWSFSTNTKSLVAGHSYKSIGSPSSPSTNALNRKKSLVSTRAVSSPSVLSSTRTQASQSDPVSDTRQPVSTPSTRSSLPRPSLLPAISRPSSSATARSSLPAPGSFSRSTFAPAKSTPSSSRTPISSSANFVRPRPPSSMSHLPAPQNHSRSSSRSQSRVAGAAGSLPARHGSQPPPVSSRSRVTTSSSGVARPTLPPPSLSTPSVSSSQALLPGRSVGSRPPPRSTDRTRVASPLPPQRPPMCFSSSTSTATSSRPPPVSTTRIPRRQSSSAQLMTTTPAPRRTVGSNIPPSVSSTPRPSGSCAKRTMEGSRPQSVAGSRIRTSLLPQPKQTTSGSGQVSSLASSLQGGRASRQGHSMSASVSGYSSISSWR